MAILSGLTKAFAPVNDFLKGNNPLLSALGSGLSILGVALSSEQRRKLSKELLAKMHEAPEALEIPPAFQQLLSSLDSKVTQMGQSQRMAIGRGYNDSLQRALGQLKQRGLSSSSLVANLAQGNQRAKQESLLGLEDALLGQRLGIQQNVSLGGLNTRAQERGQLKGIQGSIYGGLAGPLLAPQGGNAPPYLQGLMALAQFA